MLLAADYQLFAKLKEKNTDLKSIVKSLEMSSYDSAVPIISPGDENLEYVYVVMQGYLGVYQNYINEDTNMKDWRRIDSLIAGDVFGELYLIYEIPSQVLIKTEERSSLIKIPKAVFEEHIKEYYLDNMEAMIQFYRELLFGDKIQLKYLLPLAGVTQLRKIQGNVIAVRQGDKSKYIYFVKSGVFKVMREVQFLKEVEDFREKRIESYYADPNDDDMLMDNVKIRLLEVDRLQRFNSFGDRNLPADKPGDVYEPFTIISVIPSEVYVVDRQVFMQLLPKGYTLEFKSFPNDYKLRKRYYEQKCWKKFKKDVFSNLLNVDQKRKSLNTNVNYQSPKKKTLRFPKLSNSRLSITERSTSNITKGKTSRYGKYQHPEIKVESFGRKK